MQCMQGRLARTRGTHDGGKPAALEFDVYAVEGMDNSFPLAVGFGEVDGPGRKMRRRHRSRRLTGGVVHGIVGQRSCVHLRPCDPQRQSGISCTALSVGVPPTCHPPFTVADSSERDSVLPAHGRGQGRRTAGTKAVQDQLEKSPRGASAPRRRICPPRAWTDMSARMTSEKTMSPRTVPALLTRLQDPVDNGRDLLQHGIDPAALAPGRAGRRHPPTRRGGNTTTQEFGRASPGVTSARTSSPMLIVRSLARSATALKRSSL